MGASRGGAWEAGGGGGRVKGAKVSHLPGQAARGNKRERVDERLDVVHWQCVPHLTALLTQAHVGWRARAGLHAGVLEVAEAFDLRGDAMGWGSGVRQRGEAVGGEAVGARLG